MNKYICPILSLMPSRQWEEPRTAYAYCQKDKCAWYSEEIKGCSILNISSMANAKNKPKSEKEELIISKCRECANCEYYCIKEPLYSSCPNSWMTGLSSEDKRLKDITIDEIRNCDIYKKA